MNSFANPEAFVYSSVSNMENFCKEEKLCDPKQPDQISEIGL